MCVDSRGVCVCVRALMQAHLLLDSRGVCVCVCVCVCP